ncbi:MAG: PhnD/SsuA/transferrin family substrate-binding protein [Clostridium sp.]|uniref:ABC transporter substrate-binding protein n=1 Tax=Clostridium sp. TaxID=1506 RepID=UPI0025BF1C64|nr:PhnD/SsuA/transferrin family substrate-binding protein [Clostridium sp.]MCH3963181.1 PhnD/SsuA/transferrin family substrate-binding protein [Clostridium sp.]MCI1716356.1 PhnD/SsuA/transferrin family substrate-binding protein [Clostridium sp.]MCI1800696.1 PhnD/SsuA/transferrin family substrate-binding protein [Clostridium sp.]MCI1814649.1 PhnD/SsuA/transferrin family substrate-binding protein [Clostridium sp.]MCI1871559.1 PhnD/SsuA/transferrin family substrate-binding protein [Clostridium sp
MKKKFGVILTALILVFSTFFISGCSNSSSPSGNSQGKQQVSQKDRIKVAALKGPTGIGMVKLMEDDKSNYDISMYDSADQVVSKIVSGDVDIAAVPSNLAAVLYNKTKGQVKLAGINTLGVLYIVENGNSVKNINDLKGKTIYSSGKGAVPEFALNYILKKNGLDPEKDVNVVYKMSHNDVAAAVAAKKASIALLPEPFVTTVKMKDKDLNIPIDLTKEWNKVSGKDSNLIMGTVIFTKNFADKNGKAANQFLKKYKDSVDFVNKNTADAAKIVEKNGIIPKAKVAEMAIPRCNIVFISADEGKKSLKNFYSILMNDYPKSIGGKLPDENFYYTSNKNN